jgi:hypothetical protein
LFPRFHEIETITIIDMRDIKTLLTVLRDYIAKEGLFGGGMCATLVWMRREGVITPGEFYLLFRYLREHKPLEAIRKNHAFWWPVGIVAPRIQWLNKQIRRRAFIPPFLQKLLA